MQAIHVYAMLFLLTPIVVVALVWCALPSATGKQERPGRNATQMGWVCVAMGLALVLGSQFIFEPLEVSEAKNPGRLVTGAIKSGTYRNGKYTNHFFVLVAPEGAVAVDCLRGDVTPCFRNLAQWQGRQVTARLVQRGVKHNVLVRLVADTGEVLVDEQETLSRVEFGHKTPIRLGLVSTALGLLLVLVGAFQASGRTQPGLSEEPRK